MNRFFRYLKELFTGSYLDKELEEYLRTKNAVTPESVERLTMEFWVKKARKYGYY